MRRILALVIFFVIAFGGFLPPVEQSHAEPASSVISKEFQLVIASESSAIMECCGETKTVANHQHGICALDCHYLPIFVSMHRITVRISPHDPVPAGLLRNIIYSPMRPPILI